MEMVKSITRYYWRICRRHGPAQWVFIIASIVLFTHYVGKYFQSQQVVPYPYVMACMMNTFVWACCLGGVVPNLTRFAAPIFRYRFCDLNYNLYYHLNYLYLFVSSCGFGLNFFGRMFKRIVPEGVQLDFGNEFAIALASAYLGGYIFRRLFVPWDGEPCRDQG